MKEIKATAPTREELYQDYKRVREENERLKESHLHLRWIIESLREEIDTLNDRIGEQNK